jgi:hypothetical protein
VREEAELSAEKDGVLEPTSLSISGNETLYAKAVWALRFATFK